MAKVEGGYLRVNENCETSAPDVYAIGDVAAMVGGEGEVIKTGHVDAARKMAAHVAGELTSEGGGSGYAETPYFYSSAMGLDLGWKLYGKCGEGCTIVTIGLTGWEAAEKASDVVWAAFYVDSDNVIVGVLLNNGTDEMKAKLPAVVEAKAVVISTKKVRQIGVRRFLAPF